MHRIPDATLVLWPKLTIPKGNPVLPYFTPQSCASVNIFQNLKTLSYHRI